MNAEDVVKYLELAPHPDGGSYRETFRDSAGTKGCAHSAAIYYLLRAGEVSRWHRLDVAEVWHWYAGDSLERPIVPGRISPAVSALKLWCRPIIGKARGRSGLIPWRAIRSRRVSHFPGSRLRSTVERRTKTKPAARAR